MSLSSGPEGARRPIAGPNGQPGASRAPHHIPSQAGARTWRYTLVRAGAAPLDLVPGRTFVIGRHSDCNLTIPSQRVSRRHTEVVWERDNPVIRDLGSQNGTKVNNKRIKEQPLNDGDEIEIGPFFCTYRRVEAAGSVGKLNSAVDESEMTLPTTGDNLAGTFEQMSPFEVRQTLEFNNKTGTLEVFSSWGEATMVVRDGRAVYCKTAKQLGDEAVITLLTWTDGHFVLAAEVEDHPANVRMPISALLFEAGRRLDEGGRSGAG
jgi:pSer/pThr/pTyr-binding forkhead associated (FHA) protein